MLMLTMSSIGYNSDSSRSRSRALMLVLQSQLSLPVHELNSYVYAYVGVVSEDRLKVVKTACFLSIRLYSTTCN